MPSLQRLLNHPGFKAEPFTVLARGAAWAACVALGRSPVFRLSDGGERLRVPPDLRFTSVTAYLLRDWTEPELRVLDHLVPEGGTFIDIGANIGLFTLKGARLAGSRGTVIAVEPGRVSADRLEANLALNGFSNVRFLRKAVSDQVGTATLHHIALGDDPQAFSLLSDGAATEAETVETTTLDAIAAEQNLARLDCIKMDVEGAEPLVLAGGAATLDRFKPLVVFEINSGLSTAPGAEDAAWRMLAEHGYRFRQWRPGGFVELTHQPTVHGNVIAVHPEGVPLRD